MVKVGIFGDTGMVGQQIEMVIPATLVDQVTEKVIAAARTGSIGDGKIFVTPVESAIRIRTGETDLDAL